VRKPGDVFEDIAPLYNLFALKDIELTTYTVSGAYNGKTAINADILKKADLGIDNLYEGEVKARPITFSVDDPPVPAPDDNTKKKIEQWVKELGDEGYGVRLEAEQNLVKEGSVVLPFLRQARSNADAEIRDAAKRIITQVLTNKAKMITFLGIHLPMPFVDEDKGVGVLVVKLIAGGPAEKVGIKAGDLVMKIGDLPITQKDMATRAIFFGKQVRYRRKGDTIVLTIKRGEEEIKIPVTLAERNIDDPY
jgi:C-terminal processing protease CtpA/Prc